MRVSQLGYGATGGTLVQHEGSTVQFDVPALPIIGDASAKGNQQRQQQGRPGQQHAVCLLVPECAPTLPAAHLDAILVTSAWGLLGLAHLQQVLGGELPIHIYCTEPCLHFFQQLSQELIDCSHALSHQQHSQPGPQMPAQPTAHQQQQVLLPGGAPVLDQQSFLHQQLQHIMLDKQEQNQQQPAIRPSLPKTAHQQQLGLHGTEGMWSGGPQQPPVQHQGHNQPVQHTGTHPLQQLPAIYHGFQAAAPPPPPWGPVPPPRPPPAPSPVQLLPHDARGSSTGPPAPPAVPLANLAPTQQLHAAGAHSAPQDSTQPRMGPGGAAAPTVPPSPAAAPAAGAGPGTGRELPSGLDGVLRGCRPAGHKLVLLFRPKQLQTVLDAVQIVRFGQRVQLPGCFGLIAEARPCGSGIGSCMWLLSCGDQRYTYLGPSSLCPGPSAPLHQPSLHSLDLLMLGPGSLRRPLGRVPPPDCLAVAIRAAVAAVLRGGCVLVPVIAGEGAVLQLLEHLPPALAAAGPAAAATPFLYLSPAAADALATASSCCEYLEQHRQQQVLEAGTAPFDHDQLIKSGRLRILCATDMQPPPPAATAGAPGAVLRTPAVRGNGGAMDVDCPGHGSGSSSALTAQFAATEPGSCSVDAAVEEDSSSSWEQAVSQVLGPGPCVVFVSLWSMAAGPGVSLTRAWSSSPLNLLLLPEDGHVTATWLQQCMESNCLPPQQQWQWQVQYAPLAGAAVGGAAGCASCNDRNDDGGGQHPQARLTAGELLAVLEGSSSSSSRQVAGAGPLGCAAAGSRPCCVVSSSSDMQLLQEALREQQEQQPDRSDVFQLAELPAPADDNGCSSNSSGELVWLDLQLPAPLLTASLSADLADKLQLQRLRITRHHQQPQQQQLKSSMGADTVADPRLNPRALDETTHHSGAAEQHEVQDVSVARVHALLKHRPGGWWLDPLPTGPRPEAVAAVLARQQQPQQELLWGRVDVNQLLSDLQAAGFTAELLPADPVGPTEQAVVVSVDGGAAQLKLSPQESEVVCDSASTRLQLLECLMKQLHSVK